MGIRVVPKETVHARVDKYLQPDEVQVFTVRRHPVVLAWTVLPLVTVAGLFWLNAAHWTHGDARALRILGVLLALCLFLFGLSVIVWLRDLVVVTPERLLIFSGWSRHVTSLPITAAADMTFTRTLAGRFIGYGAFRLRRLGTWRRVRRIGFLPYPEVLYLELSGLIFRDPRQY